MKKEIKLDEKKWKHKYKVLLEDLAKLQKALAEKDKQFKEILITDFVKCGLTYEGAKSLMKSRKHFVNGIKGVIDFKVNWELLKRAGDLK